MILAGSWERLVLKSRHSLGPQYSRSCAEAQNAREFDPDTCQSPSEQKVRFKW